MIGPHKILFLNAQNLDFYKRKLKNPAMRVWVLTNVEESKLGYVNKRLFEEAWRMNIQLDIMYIPKFDLVCQKDGENSILYDGELVTELPDCVVRLHIALFSPSHGFGGDTVSLNPDSGLFRFHIHAGISIPDWEQTLTTLAWHVCDTWKKWYQRTSQ